MGFAPGHGGAQILALVMFSVFIYAITAWVVLSPTVTEENWRSARCQR